MDDIADALRELTVTLNQRHGENITSIGATEAKVDEAIRRIDDLHKAFPNGDWEAHRDYHAALIKRIELRNKLYEAALDELVRKGPWALILMLGSALVFYIKSKVFG